MMLATDPATCVWSPHPTYRGKERTDLRELSSTSMHVLWYLCPAPPHILHTHTIFKNFLNYKCSINGGGDNFTINQNMASQDNTFTFISTEVERKHLCLWLVRLWRNKYSHKPPRGDAIHKNPLGKQFGNSLYESIIQLFLRDLVLWYVRHFHYNIL